jgi:hypothetical protein
MARRSARREKGTAHVPNTSPPDSEIQGPPCFCGVQLLNPKHKDFRQNIQCRVCTKTYNAHSSCLEYDVQVNTKLFICKECFVPGCFCKKRHNGGEDKIIKAVCDVPSHDVSKKPHWYYVFQKCLPLTMQVPSLSSKDRWHCWKCAVDKYPPQSPPHTRVVPATDETLVSTSTR